MTIVTMNRPALDAFCAQWPCHGFPEALDKIVFEFANNGDIVDINAYAVRDRALDSADFDGPALAALADDAKAAAATCRTARKLAGLPAKDEYSVGGPDTPRKPHSRAAQVHSRKANAEARARKTVDFGKHAGFPVTLEQRGPDNFAVRYGAQYDAGLDYARAAAKLGEALMHAAACDGKIDNRTKREARRG